MRLSHFNLRILEFLNHLMSSLKMANELLSPIYNAKNKKKNFQLNEKIKASSQFFYDRKRNERKSLFFIFFKIIQLSDMKRKHTKKMMMRMKTNRIIAFLPHPTIADSFSGEIPSHWPNSILLEENKILQFSSSASSTLLFDKD